MFRLKADVLVGRYLNEDANGLICDTDKSSGE